MFVFRRARWLAVVPAIALCLLAFQNCQDFTLSSQFLVSQAQMQMDQAVSRELAKAPEYVGAYKVGSGTQAQSASGVRNGVDPSTVLTASTLNLIAFNASVLPSLVSDPASGQAMLTHKVSSTGTTVTVSVDDNPLWPAAQRAIFGNGCTTCHTGFATARPSDFVNAGLVVAGDSAGSKIYQRITSGDVNVRMPRGGAALSAADIAAIKTWIDGYTPAPQSVPTTPILTTPAIDNLIAQKFSYAAVLRKPLAHDIISLNGGTRAQEDVSILVENNQIIAVHFTDPANYTYVALPVPPQDNIVVAASFDQDPAKIILTVNGVSSTDVKSVYPVGSDGKMIGGGPSDLAYVLRQFQLGASQSGGQVTWGEARLFMKTLSQYELNVLSRELAGLWNVPNVVDDPAARDAASGVGGPPPTPQFLAALGILQDNCFSCHSEWVGKRSQQFVSMGLIVPGAVGQSPLFLRLKGMGGAQMPKDRPALSADQVQKIADWINTAQ